MFNWIDLDGLREAKVELSESFNTAVPFKHLVTDKLISEHKLTAIAGAFPSESWEHWTDNSHEHQFLKRSCRDVSLVPDPLRTVVFELNSGPFLAWLSDVTGIPNLLPDPDLRGGGLHFSGIGGTLTPHTDFHVVKGLPLYRRLNLLLYLNDAWSEGDGGELELWDKSKDRIEKRVTPLLGKTVIFQTDNISLHGFTNPIANHARHSIALYYYTAEEAETFSGDGTTYWRSDSVARSPRDRLRLLTQKGLLGVARVLSSLQWRVNRLSSKMAK